MLDTVPVKQNFDKIFAIGDIHGCADELELLIQKLPLTKESLVVFLGDYIDRGPQSQKVIDLIINLKTKHHVVALKGNHEQMLLDFVNSPESVGAGMFIFNGGSATLASYADQNSVYAIPKNHIHFFEELKPCFQTESYFFVHAGVPVIPLSEIDLAIHESELLWIRSPFLQSPFKWEKTIVHGHTPVQEPDIRSNRINVDTGCVYDGKLTAIELPSKKTYSVQRLSKKQEPIFLKDSKSQRIATRFKGELNVLVEKQGYRLAFKTLNYNQFGLLIQDLSGQEFAVLDIGERIVGVIGESPHLIRFVGVVVRFEERDGISLYGIKIENLHQ